MNVVITGTNKGIGFSLVQKFIASCKENDNVFAISRETGNLESLRNNCKHLTVLKCDITDLQQLERSISIIRSKCEAIDFLINNAGQILNKPFLEIDSPDIDQIFNANFKAPFILTKLLYPQLLISKSAHIVNISSMGGFQGAVKFPGLSVYSSSKAALACLTECLAEEFKLTSIKINALCIGAVETEMLSKAFPDYKAPLKADDMAEFIYHFTQTNHKFMNGKLIPVALSTP